MFVVWSVSPLFVTGSWVDDQRCGKGKFYYVNGDIYDGEWKDHVRHGLGSYTYADTASCYVGLWKNGQRDGQGELIHANHKFVGKFVDDKVCNHCSNFWGLEKLNPFRSLEGIPNYCKFQILQGVATTPIAHRQ